MKSYQYQIIRYIHDRLTGEFVNVGIVMFAPNVNFFKAQVLTKSGRLSNLFQTGSNWTYYLSTLKTIQKQCSLIEKEIISNKISYESIAEITKQLIPTNDSAIYFSEIKTAIDIDLSCAFNDRFERLVNKYNKQTVRATSPSDITVWKTKYKKYFEEYGILDKFQQHRITTKHDTFDFDKTWKNGARHLYEPVSFDLKSVDAIREKVYNWVGKITELHSALEKEKLKLYLLTSTAEFEGFDAEEFIESTLTSANNDKFVVELVKEDEVVEFVTKTKQDMETSEQQSH